MICTVTMTEDAPLETSTVGGEMLMEVIIGAWVSWAARTPEEPDTRKTRHPLKIPLYNDFEGMKSEGKVEVRD